MTTEVNAIRVSYERTVQPAPYESAKARVEIDVVVRDVDYEAGGAQSQHIITEAMSQAKLLVLHHLGLPLPAATSKITAAESNVPAAAPKAEEPKKTARGRKPAEAPKQSSDAKQTPVEEEDLGLEASINKAGEELDAKVEDEFDLGDLGEEELEQAPPVPRAVTVAEAMKIVSTFMGRGTTNPKPDTKPLTEVAKTQAKQEITTFLRNLAVPAKTSLNDMSDDARAKLVAFLEAHAPIV